jgi:hypothetical protein
MRRNVLTADLGFGNIIAPKNRRVSFFCDALVDDAFLLISCIAKIRPRPAGLRPIMNPRHHIPSADTATPPFLDSRSQQCPPCVWTSLHQMVY